MSTLEAAISFAALAHEGQVDKLSQPYILHPLRVMLAVSPRARVAAVLHDVLEDTAWTADALYREGYTGPDLAAVVALTRIGSEPYAEFIARCGLDAIAREVKIADIRDNLSPARFDHLFPADQARLGARYRQALAVLEAATPPSSRGAP